jgi:hypothetical protein
LLPFEKLGIAAFCLFSSFWSELVGENKRKLDEERFSLIESLLPLLLFLLGRLADGEPILFRNSGPFDTERPSFSGVLVFGNVPSYSETSTIIVKIMSV